jgi:small conductance mechanosensitive channel
MEPLSIIMNSLRDLGRQILEHLPHVISAVVILVATWGMTKILERVLTQIFSRLGIRESLSELLRKLAFIGIWIVGVLIAAIIIFPSLTPGKILTGLGLGSIAIGFAFKDIFENFLAGILILLREPFQLGDVIECETLEGFVEEITIRDTHIRQTDGQRVVIPNSMLFKNPVTVRTDRDLRRVTIMCGIAYGEDVDRARQVMQKALDGLDSVNQDKAVQIFAQGFGSSSIDFEVTWWTGSLPLDIRKSKDKVVAAVKRALDHAKIEIPFPYRTLTFKEPLETLITRHQKNQKDSHQT